MTITMYGADWCGDCRRAKAYFVKHNVAFEYIDLEANPDQVEEVLDRSGGVKRIPLIVFADGTYLIEPSNAELAAKLDEPTSGFEVLNNIEASQFELHLRGEMVGLASYFECDSVVVVPHVETFLQHRGQGFADRLMAGLLLQIRDSGRRIDPVCAFAAQYLREHPEARDLLAV